jgi:hypothetical protein
MKSNIFYHPTKNSHIALSELTNGSKKVVWWVCEFQHEWHTKFRDKSSCPYCNNRKLLVGFNDLKTLNPHLASEWNLTRNTLSPSEVLINDKDKTIWWTCEKNHVWQTSPKYRNQDKTGCPFCAGQKILVGFNDLATINPILATEWHPTKNGKLFPTQFTHKSGSSIWWLAACGHDWIQTIGHRSNGSKCPTCAGQKILIGFNDLATINPRLALEWHPTKNNKLLPTQFTHKSGTSIWWQCKLGHEWKAEIKARTNGTGCSSCVFKYKISKPEKALAAYIKSLGMEVLTSNRSILRKQELDIYIPKLKIAVEFNGVYWHSEEAGKNKTYHYDKFLACQKLGIQLIQIWESDWMENLSETKQHLHDSLTNINNLSLRYDLKSKIIKVDNCWAVDIASLEEKGYKILEVISIQKLFLKNYSFTVWDAGHTILSK